jgi:hypothetical protein
VSTEGQEPKALGERILLLAPTGRDAGLLAGSLAQSGFSTTVCADMDALCTALPSGAAAAVMAEEALAGPALERLRETLAQQPSWSDIPIIVLLATGATLASSRELLSHFAQHGNLTLL